MATDLSAVLRRIDEKLTQLSAANAQLKGELAEKTDECADLQSRLAELEKKLDKAELDNHFLRVSHRLADNPESLVESRKQIAALVRSIDKCIAQLKE